MKPTAMFATDSAAFLALVFLIFGAVLVPQSAHGAQDKIIRKPSGQVVQGDIIGVVNGQVQFELLGGKATFPLSEVERVEMVPPKEFVEAQNLPPAQLLPVLEPLLTKFKGLPAEWVVECMSLVADAHAALGDGAKAKSIYADLAATYPGNRFLLKANVGMARTSLTQKQPEKALELLAPLIARADESFVLPHSLRQPMAEAFILKGQALEQQGKLSEALASYLTTVTLFYHESTLAADAAARAKALRERDPKLVTP